MVIPRKSSKELNQRSQHICVSSLEIDLKTNELAKGMTIDVLVEVSLIASYL